MIKRLLVALSGTPFTPVAVRYGLDLALAHEAVLTGVTVLDLEDLSDVGPVPLGGGAAARELAEQRTEVTRQHVTEEIEKFEHACTAAGVECRVERERGDCMDELMNAWRYQDLAILGLRGFFEYGVVDHPEDAILKLIKGGIRPILAVAPEYQPITRAVIAYNGTRVAAKAMKQFVQMRLWPDVKIDLVCCDKSESEATTLLDPAAEYCRAHGYTVRTIADPRHPAEAIEAHVQNGANLVVMGLRARTRFLKMILGDTVAAMLKSSSAPLFLTQ